MSDEEQSVAAEVIDAQSRELERLRAIARYDSRLATYEHKAVVLKLMREVLDELLHRAVVHDDSKLRSPEREGLDEFSPRLATMEYGSPEYFQALEDMAPFLERHYAANSHHPQYHERGIHGMSLLDLLEMLADWKASVGRSPNGDLAKSIEMNAERFGYGDEIAGLLVATARELLWMD